MDTGCFLRRLLVWVLGCFVGAVGLRGHGGWECQRWIVSSDGSWILESGSAMNHAVVVSYETTYSASPGTEWCPRVLNRFFVLQFYGLVFNHPLLPGREPAGFSVNLEPDLPNSLVWSSGETATKAGPVVNCSMRARIGPSSEMIVGFVVQDRPARFLLRAVGPGLAAHGVNDAAPNPLIRLYRGGECIVECDDWTRGVNNTESIRYVRRRMRETGQIESTDPLDQWYGLSPPTEEGVAHVRRAERATGAFPLDVSSVDAALVVELAPGAYTMVVESEEVGTVLGEVYQIPH
jgi:hypothetical protein